MANPYHAPHQDPRHDEPTAEEEQYFEEQGLGRRCPVCGERQPCSAYREAVERCAA